MDAYKNSLAVAKLQSPKNENKPLRLAFIDLDGTWAGSSEEEATVYDLLQKNHYIIGQVTSRTEGLLAPDILVSVSGTRVLLKQRDGSYQEDALYAQRLPSSTKTWHQHVDQLLSRSGIPPASYMAHRIGSAAFRVEIVCQGPEAARQMITQLRALDTESIFNFARETRNFFITPAHTSKEDSVNHVIATLTQILHSIPKDFHVLFAGDTAIEIPMGFEGAQDSEATFIIPGNASLTYEPELMTKLRNNVTVAPGVYWYPKTRRHIIIGEEAFPGTVGPQTLIVWLKKNYA